MWKKISIIALLLLIVFGVFDGCSSEDDALENAVTDGVLNVSEYAVGLSENSLDHLKEPADLLLHPLKDAIALYGEDYEFSWDGVYVTLRFREAKCSFEAYIGNEFEHYDGTRNHADFNDCNVMEYLRYSKIERVIFDGEGLEMANDIAIGMSVGEICEMLDITDIEYNKSDTLISPGYDENNNRIDIYYITVQRPDVECTITVSGDILSRVDITSRSAYLTDDADNGKAIIDQAFSYLAKNKLASFSAGDLTHQGKQYSSFYDAWFNCWKFTKGSYTDYEINVEQTAPHRVYVSTHAEGMPITFWCNGKYLDPSLSFLGKWRDYSKKQYIEIRSISKEGIVVFDLYAASGSNGEMSLIKNLSTVLAKLPQTVDDYLMAEYTDEALSGEVQFFNGELQSGYYGYGGDKIYLADSLIMDLNGSVKYLPRGMGGRVGSGMLPIHLPSKTDHYTQASCFGYMEAFGRDDPNPENKRSTASKGGSNVINRYLNEQYETSGLNYAELEYKYLYDYRFPVNDTTYHVWQSNNAEDPHYLYVDGAEGMLIKETQTRPLAKHTKTLIYKNNTPVSGKAYSEQSFITLDGNIKVDLKNRTVCKADAFVPSISLSEVSYDTVRSNERFMFFSNIGSRFVLNGYILFDHTTWGATLHVTDSNVPDFDLGVYYLNSETFFLDPSIGITVIPEENENQNQTDKPSEEPPKTTQTTIRDFSGRILGTIHVDENGNKTVKNFAGKILGYYSASRDVTTDFSGKILTRGDTASALLFTA